MIKSVPCSALQVMRQVENLQSSIDGWFEKPLLRFACSRLVSMPAEGNHSHAMSQCLSSFNAKEAHDLWQ